MLPAFFHSRGGHGQGKEGGVAVEQAAMSALAEEGNLPQEEE
jgi:hypothetical protein